MANELYQRAIQAPTLNLNQQHRAHFCSWFVFMSFQWLWGCIHNKSGTAAKLNSVGELYLNNIMTILWCPLHSLLCSLSKRHDWLLEWNAASRSQKLRWFQPLLVLKFFFFGGGGDAGCGERLTEHEWGLYFHCSEIWFGFVKSDLG